MSETMIASNPLRDYLNTASRIPGLHFASDGSVYVDKKFKSVDLEDEQVRALGGSLLNLLVSSDGAPDESGRLETFWVRFRMVLTHLQGDKIPLLHRTIHEVYQKHRSAFCVDESVINQASNRLILQERRHNSYQLEEYKARAKQVLDAFVQRLEAQKESSLEQEAKLEEVFAKQWGNLIGAKLSWIVDAYRLGLNEYIEENQERFKSVY